MKNLLILFALFLGLGVANAQTKKTASKPTATKTQQTAQVKEDTPTQTKGPNKEVTQQYIINFFLNKNVGSIKSKVSNTDQIITTILHCDEVVFKECVLNLTFSESATLDYDRRSGRSNVVLGEAKLFLTIPLSQIESIEKDDNHIKFIAQYNENVIKDIFESSDAYYKNVLENGSKGKCFILCNTSSSAEIDKLIKSFNHLRKLCGAPEPIYFN